MEGNGREWKGMEWNGMEWNGMEWKGNIHKFFRSPLKLESSKYNPAARKAKNITQANITLRQIDV